MKTNIISQYKGLQKEIYILFIGRIMTNLGSMVWPILTLILSQKIGLDATGIALYTGIYSLVSIPIAFIGGKLADKFNKKRIIIICDIISVIGYIVCSTMEINMTTVIIYSIAGLFQNAEWASYDALVADLTTSKDRARAYSLSYFGNNLGLVLAPTLAGLLFKYNLNLAFLINGIAILTSTILIFFFVKNITPVVDNSEAAQYESKLDSNSNAFKFIFSTRVILLFILMSAFQNVVYGMYGYLMPLDLAAVYPDDGSVIYGTVSSLNCIIVVIFTAFITKLLKNVKSTNKLILGMSFQTLGFIIFMLFLKIKAFSYVAITVFTWGEIMYTISSSPFYSRRIPSSHRGRITSINNIFSGLFYSIFEIGIGAIYDNFGSTNAWLCVYGLAAITIGLLFVIKRLDKIDFPHLQNIDSEEDNNLEKVCD